MALEVFSKRKRRIGEWLLAEKIINQDQLDKALEVNQHSEKKLGEIIVDLGFCPEDVLVDVLSRKLGFEKVSPATMKIQEDILGLVAGNILRKHIMIPFEYNQTIVPQYYLLPIFIPNKGQQKAHNFNMYFQQIHIENKIFS